MNKEKLLQFLLEARTKTYAGDGGAVTPSFSDSDQLEYNRGDYFYRDVYYSGKRKFMGLETIYYKEEPVWSMSYFGSCNKDSKEVYSFLKQALLKNWDSARTWKNVEWKKGSYKYVCRSDSKESIEKIIGTEEIFYKEQSVYQFFYGGGLIK